MGHTYSRILLHMIFGVKDRHCCLYREMRPQLIKYLRGIARNIEVVPIELNAVDDHAHMLLGTKPTQTSSDIASKLKANSSRWIHMTFPRLKGFAWQTGYSVFSVSNSIAPRVAAYIVNQEDHHQRMSFQDEFDAILRKHGVKLDPRDSPS